MGSSTHIPRLSLTSAVADKLREKIVRGEIPEGVQLRQDAIAREFQVSRIPVREALRHLEAEGLITIIPNRGAVVSSLSSGDIEELFEMRALLECAVLRASIPHLQERAFAGAERVLQQYEEALWNEENVAKWGGLNWQFHSALYSGAARPQFLSVIRSLNYKAERYIRLQLYLTRAMERARKEHRELLDLCRAGDVEGAVALLDRHIRFAGKSLREFVEQQREKKKKS